MIAVASPGRGSLSRSRALMTGRPAAGLDGKPSTHFMPRRSPDPSPGAVAPLPGPIPLSPELTGMKAGIACPNDPEGRGGRGLLVGTAAPPASPRSVASARGSLSGRLGMAAVTSADERY